MDLRDVLKVLWRYKWLMMLSVLVGLYLAGTVSQKSYTTYESKVALLVDEQGFGLGRIDSRLSQIGALAYTYTAIIMSDPVIGKVRQKYGPLGETINAQTAANSPVIAVSVSGPNLRRTKRIAQATVDSFLEHFIELQAKNKIPSAVRVKITQLGQPSSPVPLQSRKTEIMLLMFLAPVLATSGFSFILKNLSDSKPQVIPKENVSELPENTKRARPKASAAVNDE